MATKQPTPLILFSGLAADANVFVPQKLAFPQLIVPRWQVPRPRETLDAYCKRFADELRSGERAIIGGASFGGIIALHVAQYLDPLAVLLIGSIRSPAELPWRVRFARPLRPWVRFIPVRFLQLLCVPLTAGIARRKLPHLSGLARQFRGSEPTIFRWSLAHLLDWNTAPDVTCPVFHLHGDRDFVLPAGCTQPDSIVAGGGHILSLSNPSEVNDFIRSAISQTLSGLCDK